MPPRTEIQRSTSPSTSLSERAFDFQTGSRNGSSESPLLPGNDEVDLPPFSDNQEAHRSVNPTGVVLTQAMHDMANEALDRYGSLRSSEYLSNRSEVSKQSDPAKLSLMRSTVYIPPGLFSSQGG